jgi:hypothetical protein
MYIGSNIGERIREEKVSGKTRLSNLKADGDDGHLNTGLDPRPNTHLLWAINWALKREDGSKLGVHAECYYFFTATSMLL